MREIVRSLLLLLVRCPLLDLHLPLCALILVSIVKYRSPLLSDIIEEVMYESLVTVTLQVF